MGCGQIATSGLWLCADLLVAVAASSVAPDNSNHTICRLSLIYRQSLALLQTADLDNLNTSAACPDVGCYLDLVEANNWLTVHN